ncbi:NAD(P)-dependent alcohol dehydrogenase [Aspergillus stella-maris]|uniref:NAD(P)-dependent alcohol dehydrogenase n=1 Tax=Aspergillus stella-maris TaxID=1810926 RepID=UPI003CCE5421
MPSFTVFKGQESGNPVQSTTTKSDELIENYVLLRVTASGLCGTDLHYRKADMVLGHEGVGIIEAVGPEVRFLKKGDRVGWGYETDSCGHCIECLQGTETYCAQRDFYGEKNFDQGSFASHAVWRESFLHKIPEGMSDAAAAPLQCGGATVFNALVGVKSTDTVGILGVGGLGHLAIQFAAKMGCRVVVLSGSDRKREEALRLGAHEFVATKGATELSVTTKLDRLIVSAAVPPNWDLLLPILAPRAQIYPLTVSSGNFEIPYMTLISAGIQVIGSLVPPRAIHRKMLEFAAMHKIEPMLETFPMTEEGIAEAMDKLDKGQVNYRAVLITEGK